MNLKGREGPGIVSPGGEADAIKQEIASQLAGLSDAGRSVINQVYDSAELYDGPFAKDAPELVVGFEPGYRTSWQTAIGGYPDCLMEDNIESWSGDHLVDPTYVPGVLFLNRKSDVSDPHVKDIAPTVLALLGLDAPTEMEGRPLVAP